MGIELPYTRALRLVMAGLAASLLTQCATIEYYAQSVAGQWDLLARQRPVSAIIADSSTPASLAQDLQLALDIRRFASDALALPDNHSYLAYVALDEPYVLWSVFAAPEFSVQPRQWCAPIAGCFAYRGYYDRGDAQAAARRQRARGLDVYVGGIVAYSTVGWFDDPLLSTMLRWSEPQLAAIVFHELAHQRVYVPGDTMFNESFATVVEQEGVRRWLLAHGAPEAWREYLIEQRRAADLVQWVMETRSRLATVYRAPHSEETMRRAKQRMLARAEIEYQKLKRRWGGYSGYDRWLAGGLNNAKLASVATYHYFVPGFRALLERNGGDLGRFYRAAERLGRLSESKRRERLEALAAGSTEAS